MKDLLNIIKPFLFCCIAMFIPTLSFSQATKEITGKAINVIKDTLIIYPDNSIPKKYYEIKKTLSQIDQEHFSVSFKVTYPQLLYTIFSKDQGYVLNRPKAFFVDETSTAILINTSNWEKSHVVGEVGDEFEQKFKPFADKQMAEVANYSLYTLPFLRDVKADTVLYNYSSSNPDSFIPLWFLIKRFYQFGHSELREHTLELFSNNIKGSKIWRLLDEDMENALLKQGSPFPSMKLLDPNLNASSLSKNQGEYFLLDFWFTSCKPCIQALPRLNDIYRKHRKNGLEIISISVDREATVEKWRSRILEEDMRWKHYLDLNGVSSSDLMVNNFPRYVLLNGDWNVVNTDISLDQLEQYLDYNL